MDDHPLQDPPRREPEASDGHGQAAPEVQARIRESFGRQGLMSHLGARITRIEAGRVHIALPARPEVTQQNGYFHAGATSAIADSAGGYAAYTLFPEGADILTVEYKINLLAPAVGERLEAVGSVLKAGRTLTVCGLEVFGVDDGRRRLVANGQQTLIRVTP
ncbi:PaaI family thioesterase [Nocardiopsis sp. RSe5-2]|uniref:PaaI family thioesterase n=1 Tax=Nocardiopsis endophytica TaxID=3018445 RepID=A0ABT4U751_9ACTN|nr:PaaI family thioesterase [Nocardiopsis endophytica]MDA2812782.1 PaaI family thioesterase [Nocardiopsis endophytica]